MNPNYQWFSVDNFERILSTLNYENVHAEASLEANIYHVKVLTTFFLHR